MSFDPGRLSFDPGKNILYIYKMWQLLIVLFAIVIAFLVIRKNEKKKNPKSSNNNLLEKADIVDIFGEDLLDLSEKNS